MLATRALRGVVASVAAVALAIALAACGSDDDAGQAAAEDPGPAHVHGLGINPADGALMIATHTGLYRSEPDELEASRVGEVRHDLMGFLVIGEDEFLASGHPGIEEGGPPHLGLIRSDDGGESWSEVSLHGEADFHVLRRAGERIIGYDSVGGRLLASEDDGVTWDRLREPEGGVIDVAADPDDPRTLVAATQAGLVRSADGGRTWNRLGDEPPGLLSWPDSGLLVRVEGDGGVYSSDDGGRSWALAGDIGGQPAALVSVGGELYAALHDASVVHSRDAGETWRVSAR